VALAIILVAGLLAWAAKQERAADAAQSPR
jgi:hypothetical protein